MTRKIQKLIQTSRQVLKDCALENGAIVAANTDQPYYPRGAANYHYVWPRDAAFVCVACDILRIPVQEKFFHWLTERPEDFQKEGLLFQKYSTNGRLSRKQFQPDQMGIVLWALHYHFKENLAEAKKFETLIRRLADGLSSDWRETYFFHNSVDLWEEEHRQTSSHLENNFTYSLAACIYGLKCAHLIVGNEEWIRVAGQMRSRIDLAYDKKRKYFLRNYGKISDYNVDASLLGLVWPFEILEAHNPRIVNTVQLIEKIIVSGGGLHRYQFDYYDGEGTAQEGGGAWPLLNFWISIYWALYGHKKKALSYYNWVVDQMDRFDYYIPEQIFEDSRMGVYPLAWSHAMFVIASRWLGLI